MGKNRLGSQSCILQLLSKPQWPHLRQAGPAAAISPSKALLWFSPIISPSPALMPALLPFTAARGNNMFYHITALLTALSLSPLKYNPDSLPQLSRPGVIWLLLGP